MAGRSSQQLGRTVDGLDADRWPRAARGHDPTRLRLPVVDPAWYGQPTWRSGCRDSSSTWIRLTETVVVKLSYSRPALTAPSQDETFNFCAPLPRGILSARARPRCRARRSIGHSAGEPQYPNPPGAQLARKTREKSWTPGRRVIFRDGIWSTTTRKIAEGSRHQPRDDSLLFRQQG